MPEILRLIVELAEYEKARAEVVATEEDLTALLFGDNTPQGTPAAYAHVVDAEPSTGRLAGFAFWFVNASTWQGTYGIYLEDLYVSPEHRGRGFGRRLMAELADLCVQRGYRRLDWAVLDWNSPAISFYDAIGAQAMSGWTGRRLTGDPLQALAAERTVRER